MHIIIDIRTDIVNCVRSDIYGILSVLYFKSKPTGGVKDTMTEKRCY